MKYTKLLLLALSTAAFSSLHALPPLKAIINETQHTISLDDQELASNEAKKISKPIHFTASADIKICIPNINTQLHLYGVPESVRERCAEGSSEFCSKENKLWYALEGERENCTGKPYWDGDGRPAESPDWTGVLLIRAGYLGYELRFYIEDRKYLCINIHA